MPKHTSTSITRTRDPPRSLLKPNASTCCNFDVIHMRWKNISTYIVLSGQTRFLNQILFRYGWKYKNACNQIINQAVRSTCSWALLHILTVRFWFLSTWYKGTMHVLLLLMSIQNNANVCDVSFSSSNYFSYGFYNRIHWVLDCCFQFIEWIARGINISSSHIQTCIKQNQMALHISISNINILMK